MENFKKYLGDGAYAEFDGYYIVLTTSDYGITVTNRICLEKEVFKTLVEYEKMIKKVIAEQISTKKSKG